MGQTMTKAITRKPMSYKPPRMWFRNDPDWMKTSFAGSIALAIAALGGFLISRADAESIGGIAIGVAGVALIVGAFLAFRAFLRLL